MDKQDIKASQSIQKNNIKYNEKAEYWQSRY